MELNMHFKIISSKFYIQMKIVFNLLSPFASEKIGLSPILYFSHTPFMKNHNSFIYWLFVLILPIEDS